MEKNNKRTKILSVIAILSIIGGLFSIFTSIPLYSLYTSINQGGLTVGDKVSIMQVIPNSPAADAKLKAGDIILSVNGQNINKPADFTDISNTNQEKIISIVIDREGNIQTVQLTPRITSPPNEGRVGIALSNSRVEKKPLYQIIPQVIIRGYSGYEEQPVFLFSSYKYQDKSFSRLQSLISGIISVVIGIGLWRLRKWSMYGFLVLAGYSIIVSVSYLLNPASYVSNQPQSLFFRGPTMIDTLIYIVGLIIEVLFAVYIYKQRKLFR